MATRRSTLSIAATVILVLACGEPPTDPTGVAPSFDRGGNGGRRAWSPWSEPVNLGPPINTSLGELQPALSKDGLSLYFTSTDRAGGVGGNDIWVSQRNCADGPWGTPVNLAVINTPFLDGGPTLSDDGHLLFFHSGRPGGPGSNDIYVSRRANRKDDFGWEAPKLLGTDVNTAALENKPDYHDGNLYFNRGPNAGALNDLYYAPVTRDGETRGPAVLIAELNDPVANDAGAMVRADGREIFFTSGRAGTLGLADLWVSTRRSDHEAWSTPQNVGTPVNTAFQEQHAYLSRDARTLVFASNRPGSDAGSSDIWMSTRTLRGGGDDDDDDDDDDKTCRGDDDDGDGDDG